MNILQHCGASLINRERFEDKMVSNSSDPTCGTASEIVHWGGRIISPDAAAARIDDCGALKGAADFSVAHGRTSGDVFGHDR